MTHGREKGGVVWVSVDPFRGIIEQIGELRSGGHGGNRIVN
jgi:hypothetical protein